MGKIDDQWRSYAECVLPANASVVQRMECRRAFYGGAAALFNILLSQTDEGEDPTDKDVELMQGLNDELETFCKQVERNQA